MKQTISIEDSVRIDREVLVSRNIKLQHCEFHGEGMFVRALYITPELQMADVIIASKFYKYGEMIDEETGITTWYGKYNTRIEFNKQGIAYFIGEQVKAVWDISEDVPVSIEDQVLLTTKPGTMKYDELLKKAEDTVQDSYQRLFTKPGRQKRLGQ